MSNASAKSSKWPNANSTRTENRCRAWRAALKLLRYEAVAETDRFHELRRRQYEFVSATLTDPGNPRVAETEGLLAAGQREAGQRALDHALAVLELKQPKNAQLAGWHDLLKASRRPATH